MKFGPVSMVDSEGAILAHAVRTEAVALKKGDALTAERRRLLMASGVESVIAARLEEGDVGENEAALALATKLAGAHVSIAAPFTGRVNLFAERAGLAVIDGAAIDRVNGIDEAITLATLPRFQPVAIGDMVATVKIIPFAARGETVAAALEGLGARPPVSVAPFRPVKVAVVSTLLPGLKASAVVKTLRVLEDRLAPTQARIVAHETTPHDSASLAGILDRLADAADVVIVFGASAITDRRDVIPAAIEAIGGTIERFGMPVDPGNLLLLARRGAAALIGAPGCARSPKENGFDWVLRRLIAGIPVTSADIRSMGVGGLLTEITTRPQPREPQPRPTPPPTPRPPPPDAPQPRGRSG